MSSRSQGNIFSRRKMIIGTLIVSAGAHVSSNEPAIVLFGYLRHGLVGRGVMLFGVILLLLNFLDGLYKLARLNWHIAYQIVMTIRYIALSVRLDSVDPCLSRRITGGPRRWRAAAGARLSRGELATARPCRPAKARRRWSRGTARCGRRRARRRRKSSGRRRRRPTAARTVLRAAASAAARSRSVAAAPRQPPLPLPEPAAARLLRHRRWPR